MTGRAERIDTTDGVELAMGRASGSAEATSLLERQSLLIQAQETLARADLRHRGWQIISERVGAALKALTALAGILVLAGIASFLWSASRASGMVVDAFSVPPTMDAQGLTGAVVAGQLLDKVSAMESSTESARAPSSYENSWSDTDGVVVPYAGVSLGELRRDARAWLGSETHLKGEVVKLGGGRIAIAFRAGKTTGRVEGNETQFDVVLQQAAAAVFKATQPYRYVVWLGRNGGNPAEANQVLAALARSPDQKEKLWAMHGLALNATSNAEAKAIYQRALRLSPDFVPAIGNMPEYALAAGQEEEAFKLRQRAAAAYRSGQPDYNPMHGASYALESEAELANFVGDWQGEARMRNEAIDQVAADNVVTMRPFSAAWAHALIHDFTTARTTLAAAGYLDPARLAEVESKYGKRPSLKMLNAIATDDSGAIVDELQMTIASLRKSASVGSAFGYQGQVEEFVNTLRPSLARALARSDRWREAETVIAPMPGNHDEAIRARGLIAAHAGRSAASDAMFSRAVARTPSLPSAHHGWAEALMLRKDYPRAIEQAQFAHRKGPRWAEPLKLWGDALYAQGKPGEAAERYAMAAERAPRWGLLHVRWAAALWASGDRKQARSKLAEASGMDLNDADRARLRAMLRAAAA